MAHVFRKLASKTKTHKSLVKEKNNYQLRQLYF